MWKVIESDVLSEVVREGSEEAPGEDAMVTVVTVVDYMVLESLGVRPATGYGQVGFGSWHAGVGFLDFNQGMAAKIWHIGGAKGAAQLEGAVGIGVREVVEKAHLPKRVVM